MKSLPRGTHTNSAESLGARSQELGAGSWERRSEVRGQPHQRLPAVRQVRDASALPHHKRLTIRSFHANFGQRFAIYPCPQAEEVTGGIVNGLRYGFFHATFGNASRSYLAPGRRGCGHRKRLTIWGSFHAILGNASRYSLAPWGGEVTAS